MNAPRGTTPTFDVIVIGAGHAGCEAALASARAGCSTLVITPNLDRIGYMPCNPSIGGPGKGHMVAEIDALGGEMGRAADRTALQVRQLNTSKGPAVQAIRIQSDKVLYSLAMKEALETQVNLSILQDEAIGVRLLPGPNDSPVVHSVKTKAKGELRATAIVITAGTFLRGRLISGENIQSGGRSGEPPVVALSQSLSDIGFSLRRLKTGTPPRIDARTVDFTAGDLQLGSESGVYFSRDARSSTFEPLRLPPHPVLAARLGHDSSWAYQLACLRLGTSHATHDLIRANLFRAPMFNGTIDGVGPRYCPSIEDKVARFGDKSSHPVFLEPEGWRSLELYVQGMSTSLPPDVQDAAIRSIRGLERAEITRYGYAVEYDAVDASELSSSLESRQVAGLFLAGQINGTSGYEEAAGQGLMAGVNAANRVLGRAPLVLHRDQAYIGVMIDDLVSAPLDEPYRMLTSRAEHRLLLRPDTAHRRLARIAYEHGLIDRDRFDTVEREDRDVATVIARLADHWISPNPRTDAVLTRFGLLPVSRPMTAAELLRRPDASVSAIASALRDLGEDALDRCDPRIQATIENDVKYGGFIERAEREAKRSSRLETRPLTPDLDFTAVPGLRIEARAKLSAHRPETVAQARRLSGLTPADVAALLVHTQRATSKPT